MKKFIVITLGLLAVAGTILFFVFEDTTDVEAKEQEQQESIDKSQPAMKSMLDASFEDFEEDSVEVDSL